MAVGRPCKVCTSPERAQIEAELLSDNFAGFAAVHRRYAHLSEDSLARHASNHLQQVSDEPRSLFRGGEKSGLSAAEIADRRRAVADSARASREALEAAGRHVEAGKAAAIEDRILSSMEARAPHQAKHEEDVSSLLQEANVLAAVVGRVARQNPLFGRSVVAELRARGADDLASELERTSRKAVPA